MSKEMTPDQREEIVGLITELEKQYGCARSASLQLAYMLLSDILVNYAQQQATRATLMRHLRIVSGTDMKTMIAAWLEIHTQAELVRVRELADTRERVWTLQELLTVVSFPYTSMKRVIESNSHMLDPLYANYDVLKKNLQWALPRPATTNQG
jgi:hypothetical protein